MNGLIKLNQSAINGETVQTVNARELHQFLEVGRDFSNWIKGRIEKYGFVENQDYVLTFQKTGKRQNVVMTEYHISLDMAKELAMVENNDKGREALRHIFECNLIRETDFYSL